MMIDKGKKIFPLLVAILKRIFTRSACRKCLLYLIVLLFWCYSFFVSRVSIKHGKMSILRESIFDANNVKIKARGFVQARNEPVRINSSICTWRMIERS